MPIMHWYPGLFVLKSRTLQFAFMDIMWLLWPITPAYRGLFEWQHNHLVSLSPEFCATWDDDTFYFKLDEAALCISDQVINEEVKQNWLQRRSEWGKHWEPWVFLCPLSPSPPLHSEAEPHFSLSPIYYQCICNNPSFHVLFQIQLQLGFGFPNPISACLNVISMCLLSYLPLFLPHACSLLCLNLVKKQLVLSAGLLGNRAAFACFSCSGWWTALELREHDPGKKLPDLPDTPFLWVHITWDFSKQDSEEVQVFSPKVQGYGPVICLASSSQDPPSHSHNSQSCPWPLPP